MAGLAQAGEALTASLADSPGRPGLARRLWRQSSGRAGLIILAVMVLAGLASLAGLAPDAPDAQNPWLPCTARRPRTCSGPTSSAGTC